MPVAEDEWKILYCTANKTQISPSEPHTIAEALIYLAKLAGWGGAKSDGSPRLKVIWLGLSKLNFLLDFYLFFAKIVLWVKCSTQERDTESIIQIDMKNLRYTLPGGFQITDMANNYDLVQFDRIMHRGFSGELEERTRTLTDIKYVDRQFKRPFVNLDLQIAVITPDKTWAAFCCM